MTSYNNRQTAAGKLCAAFLPEMVQVSLARQNQSVNLKLEQILTEAFPRHAAAVEEFRFHVKKEACAVAYEEAWKKYYDVGGSPRFFDYYMGTGGHDLFEKRVAAILKFARE